MASSPVAQLFDVFPVLRYLPDILLPIRKRAKEGHKLESDLFVGLYLDTKKQLYEGTAKVRHS
jgi:hypothetical protein